MKTKIAQRLSLRCKFKDEDTVEMTVVDHETCDTYQILWGFRKVEKQPEVKHVSKEGK